MGLMTRRRSLLKETGGVTPPTPGGDWYGVDWFYANSSPQLTRTGAAANFSDPQPATSVSGQGSSPFDSIMPWAGMKRYNIINGAVSYSQDDAGFSQTDDTVVYIPEFYYRAEKDTTDQVWSWAISPTAQEGFAKHPGSGRYVGRYHTSGSSAGVYSKSGVVPLVSTSQTNFRTYSHNKGTNWYMLDLASWSAIQMLYLVEFANFNSQTVLGTGYAGVTSAVAAGGDTDSAVYHTLKIDGGHNQYRWIEDPYSNCCDWVDGFLSTMLSTSGQLYAERYYVGVNNSSFNGTAQALDFSTDAANSIVSGLIIDFVYEENLKWAFLPLSGIVSSQANYDTFCCDYNGVCTTGTNPVAVGSTYSNTQSNGLFRFYCSSTAAAALASYGSRLIFIP